MKILKYKFIKSETRQRSGDMARWATRRHCSRSSVGGKLLEEQGDGLLVHVVESAHVEPLGVSSVVRLKADLVVLEEQRSLTERDLLANLRGLRKHAVGEVADVPRVSGLLHDGDEPSAPASLHLDQVDGLLAVGGRKKHDASVTIGSALSTVPTKDTRSEFLHDSPPKVLDYRETHVARDRTMSPITDHLSVLRHKSQEAASAASWECLKIFSFLLLTESGISFCPPERTESFVPRVARLPVGFQEFRIKWVLAKL